MKKLFSIVLALVLCICSVPLGTVASSEDFEIAGDFAIENGDVLFLYMGSDDQTVITVPPGIRIIDDYALCYVTGVKKVVLPASVTEIRRCAFKECISLSEINIPNKVKLIGEYAFLNCPKLLTVTIPRSVTAIEQLAFGYNLINGREVLTDGFVIYGETGTEAERYAKDNGIKFVSTGTTVTDPVTATTADSDPASKFVACNECSGKGNVSKACGGCDGTGNINNDVSCAKCKNAGTVTTSETCFICGGVPSAKIKINCKNCKGSGKTTSYLNVTCSVCSGKGNIKCSKCSGSGTVTKLEKCVFCNGTLVCTILGVKTTCSCVYAGTPGYCPMKSECTSCWGRGTQYCSTCDATGKVKQYTDKNCPDCAGLGYIYEMVSCDYCTNGKITSTVICPDCKGASKLVTCSDCNGKGSVSVQCTYCGGAGKILAGETTSPTVTSTVTTSKDTVTTTAESTNITSTTSIFYTYTTITEPGMPYIQKGDFNLNGIVDAQDASDLLTYYADRMTGNMLYTAAEQAYAGDVNGDGSIDAVDASLILSIYADAMTVNIPTATKTATTTSTAATTTAKATATTAVTTTTFPSSSVYVNEDFGFSVVLPEAWLRLGVVTLSPKGDTVRFCYNDNDEFPLWIFEIEKVTSAEWKLLSDYSDYEKLGEAKGYVYFANFPSGPYGLYDKNTPKNIADEIDLLCDLSFGIRASFKII